MRTFFISDHLFSQFMDSCLSVGLSLKLLFIFLVPFLALLYFFSLLNLNLILFKTLTFSPINAPHFYISPIFHHYQTNFYLKPTMY
jgi:hypothetical protein